MSDPDRKPTCQFLNHPLKCGIKTQASVSHISQTCGVYEIINRMVFNFLRCHLSHRQTDWCPSLPAAGFEYILAFSEDLGRSPFERALIYNPKAALGFQVVSTSHCRV